MDSDQRAGPNVQEFRGVLEGGRNTTSTLDGSGRFGVLGYYMWLGLPRR